MSSSSKINSKIVSLRRKQRALELEQIRNSMRFSSQFDLYLQMTEGDKQQAFVVSQEKLRDILMNEKIEDLSQAIIRSGEERSQLFQQYVLEVVNLLKSHLMSPLALISLGNLINSSDLYRQTVLTDGCFEALINYLSKLIPGSQSQHLYIWVLCLITDRPSRLKQRQQKLLLGAVQQLLTIKLDKEQENQFLIRLIKNLSEVEVILSEDLTIAFANLFWATTNQISKLNIYLTCSRLILSQLYHRSTKVLMHILAVCLRGRCHLDKEKFNMDQMLPSVYSLLIHGLDSYNENWEEMQAQCSLEIQEQSMVLGLHQFLLTFQSSYFSKQEPKAEYYTFLKLFCTHAPLQLLVDRWFKLGTFDSLTQNISSFPHTRYPVLQIYELLCLRIAREEGQRSWLLERIKSETRLKESVEEVLAQEYSKEVVEKCVGVLEILETMFV